MSSGSTAHKFQLREKAQLMSTPEMDRTLARLAHEIVEKNSGGEDMAFVGIRRRGVPLAERLGRMASRIENKHIRVGALDITFYRDDLSTLAPRPLVKQSNIDFEIEGKRIILVDDVLFTGRTIRAAIEALFLCGRPARVQLCVLIDRGHRELPIEAAYVGRAVPTTMREVIEVKVNEIDGIEKVLLLEK
ncbi:MAG: bifunctional pyr operon transcriptional regulator/uracil phosphoribosyltransferase PyrR [Acidobacteria bacterium]|nr:MAG: bifunctional pyr operon transcriptional regulator/uracil phosphoribosyltransferase PyrR [Acidobacteriota bacterium]